MLSELLEEVVGTVSCVLTFFLLLWPCWRSRTRVSIVVCSKGQMIVIAIVLALQVGDF